jgi:hypothetical protein
VPVIDPEKTVSVLTHGLGHEGGNFVRQYSPVALQR